MPAPFSAPSLYLLQIAQLLLFERQHIFEAIDHPPAATGCSLVLAGLIRPEAVAMFDAWRAVTSSSWTIDTATLTATSGTRLIRFIWETGFSADMDFVYTEAWNHVFLDELIYPPGDLLITLGYIAQG